MQRVVAHAPNTKWGHPSTVITPLDDDRSETYATLDEAIEAAQSWYTELAGNKLPTWNYSIESLQDIRRVVNGYKVQNSRSARV